MSCRTCTAFQFPLLTSNGSGAPESVMRMAFSPREKPVHDAVADFIGKTACEDSINITFHHRRHRQPPKRIEDSQHIRSANVILRPRHIRACGMIGIDGRKLMRAENRIEARAVKIKGPLAVPELRQFGRISARQSHCETVFSGMGNDDEVLHLMSLTTD